MTGDRAPAEATLAYIPFESSQAMFRHLEKRIAQAEALLAAIETDRAVAAEKRKFMEARFDGIDRRLDRIEGHIARLVWLIIAGILGGVMSLLVQGNIWAA